QSTNSYTPYPSLLELDFDKIKSIVEFLYASDDEAKPERVRKRTFYTEEDKLSYLKKFKNYNGTKTKFCEENNIKYQTFLKWEREYNIS
ncbi:hypothetical protein KI659_17905, partial [Litoribacter alkaliphilus]